MRLLHGGRDTRLAVLCLLISTTAMACAAPGASTRQNADGQVSGTATEALPSPSGATTPVPMPPVASLPIDTGAPPGPVPTGCASGTVAITHLPAEQSTATVCLRAGARLRLYLNGSGVDGWTPLAASPGSAATIAYLSAPKDTTVALVTPTGTTPFCLSTGTRSLESQPASEWKLCVNIHH
jgi:hypothetical protein